MENTQNSWLLTGRALLDFIDRSPTPFHATSELADHFTAHGFDRLDETMAWDITPGGRYFVVRGDSSLLAFVAGTAGGDEASFKIIGAHTDSPNLRLKPNPTYAKAGYVQLGVEVYGGVLLATWTDRDLSLAGRVGLRGKSGTLIRRVKFDRPLLRIPQLAIHLNREVNEKGLILNKQSHMPPVLTCVEGELKTEEMLRELVAKELDCKASDILSCDLMLYDVQKSALGGPQGEFLFASRLDNLASCHAAALALTESASKDDPATRVAVFYDHEEVGSESAQGGGSPFLGDTLERLLLGASRPREAFMRAMARSLFISSDMAHALHPNYSELHDSRHGPLLNGGPVIKMNASQRYATDGISSARFEGLCQRAGVPVQKFVIRTDMQCGSTIGPITAAGLGIHTVDVGSPMLSMHSIREMAGTRDHESLIRVFEEFYRP